MSVSEALIGAAFLGRFTLIASWGGVLFSMGVIVFSIVAGDMKCGCLGQGAFLAWRMRLFIGGTIGVCSTILLVGSFNNVTDGNPVDTSMGDASVPSETNAN